MGYLTGKKLIFCLLLSLALAGAVFAQETVGGIRGEVTDPSGAVIPNATVTVSGAGLMRPQEMKTDAAGTYAFLTLPPGMYEVTATADGFVPTKRVNLNLQVGKTLRIDFKLEVGATTQSVEVISEAAIVDVTQSTVAANVTASSIDHLPKGRGFDSLIALAPGARHEAKGGGYQVDGASGGENVYLIDGMDQTSLYSGELPTSGNIPFEFVQELQIKSSGFEAEYGGAMGGVINVVSKSGGNDFHGDIGLYFRTDSMQARPRPTLQVDPEDDSIANYLQNETDSYRYLSPGATLGGYLKKDMLWFFAGYYPELTKYERPVTFLADGSSGVFEQKRKRDYLNGKIDVMPFTKLHGYVGYIYSPYRVLGDLPARNGSSDPHTNFSERGSRSPAASYTFGADYTATPRLVLALRGGYNYTNYKDYGVPRGTSLYSNNNTMYQSVIPPQWHQSYSGYYPGYGLNDMTVMERNKRFRTSANLSYIFNAAGQHTIKTGWEMNKLNNATSSGYWPDGYLRFYWNGTYNGQTSRLGESMRGTYGYLRYYLYGTAGEASSNNHSIFFQDSWQIRRNVTLQLGIRTEREFVPSFIVNDRIASKAIEFGFGQKIAPRLGVAWDVKGDGKWKVAGSFGLFYDLMKYAMPQGSFGGAKYQMWFYPLDNPDPEFYIAKIPRDANGAALYEPLLDLPLFEHIDYRIASNDPDNNTIDPNLKPMRRRVYDISTEYAFSPTLVLSARYTHNSIDRAIEDVGTLSDRGETYFIANPGFGITVDPNTWGPGYPMTPKAKRVYDAVELRLDKRFSNNYYFSTSYTISRLYGNYSGLASSDEPNADGEGRMDPNVSRYFDLPWMSFDSHGKLVEGRLATDRPHAFKFFGAYTLRSKVGETNFGPSFMVMSGTPLTTQVDINATTPVYVNGRGDLGRTPVFSQTDFLFYHEFRLPNSETKKFRFDANITNLFNQSTVLDRYTDYLHQDYSGNVLTFNPPEAFFQGFDWQALVNQEVAAGNLLTDPRFGMDRVFQGPRYVRLGIKFIF